MISSVETNEHYPLSNVHAEAKIHSSVRIEPYTTVEAEVEIGEGSWIGANVVIRNGVKIGKNCRIHPGSVISSDIGQLEFCHKKPTVSNGLRPEVHIHDRVHIEPNVCIHGAVSIGEGCWIGSNVTIHDGARIGKGCKIFPGAVLSAIPQDLKFKGERTLLEIGDDTIIREFATLNRGTVYHGKTVIGSKTLIMAYVHVAHDCIIGDNVVIANAVNMGGHVEIGDYAVIGGTAAIHQFVKIGRHVMLQGGSLVGKDIPPFITAGRFPVQYDGVNIIGLRRRGFTSKTIHHLQDIYRQIFLSRKNTRNALKYIEKHIARSPERDEIINFIRQGKRGIIKGPLAPVEEPEADNLTT
ncbi:MAG: acyl-ACP--UDP-N-acetylglucosamine O-acyltransferase [Bacteroidetes bacterium]|nr:MAG: acyl-ACP--UDP-N-acetylglucosamine O-acyltransferase [Bacteroidota bacterium]